MQKKGQLTIFIIIGVLILIFLGLFYFVQPTAEEEATISRVAPVEFLVESCIEKTAENALLLVGVQGGYIYFNGRDSFDTFYSEVAYWYKDGLRFTPSRQEVAEQISRYIEEEINDRCLNDFKSMQMEVIQGDIEAVTIIGDDAITIEVDFPLIITEGRARTEISRFNARIPVQLGRAIDVGNRIVDMEVEDPQNIDLSYLSGLEMQNMHYPYPEDSVVIYSVIDSNYLVLGEPFRLVFANRILDTAVTPNREPYFIAVPVEISLSVGERFQYDLLAEDMDGDLLMYSSSNPLFTITPITGTIDFTPSAEDVGDYEIIIKVSDGDSFDYETIPVRVRA